MSEKENMDQMDPHAFCEMIMNTKIGGFGRAFLPENVISVQGFTKKISPSKRGSV